MYAKWDKWKIVGRKWKQHCLNNFYRTLGTDFTTKFCARYTGERPQQVNKRTVLKQAKRHQRASFSLNYERIESMAIKL